MGLISKTHVKNYAECLQKLTLRLLESEYFSECPELQKHLLDLVLSTVPNNELMHGLTTTLCLLHFHHSPSEEQLEDTYVIGWCLQMFATCYLISDDLFDESETRHYKPCWYLRKGKGSKALLDVVLLENCVFYLLQQYFENKSYYHKMVAIFQKAKHKIAHASVYEELLSLKSKQDSSCSILSMDNYKLCVSFKMAFYPIYIHVLMAMLLNGVKNPEHDSELGEIFAKIDFHFQVRDDYLDAYGDNSDHESETGTDIEKGRCSWNICKALKICSEAQKTALLANYGRQNDKEARGNVKGIYDKINLPHGFSIYELEAFHDIQKCIEAFTAKQDNKYFPSELFQDMMWASFRNTIKHGLHSDGLRSYEKRIRKNTEDQSDNLTKLKTWASDFFDFLGHYPDFVSLCSDVLKMEVGESIGDAFNLNRLLYYNVLPGKKIRGILVVKAIKMCYAGKDSTELLKKAQAVGWCIEMLQAAALIADDIMDNGSVRRGQSCWYRLPNIGRSVLNDALFLTTFVLKMLNETLANEHYLGKLESLFQTVILQTTYGQQQDALLGMGLNLLAFTIPNYETLVKFKTAYYTLVLPVLSGLIMSGISDGDTINSLTDILLRLGYFYQVNDDYMDSFGDKLSRKTNNDIEEGKCTWLICKAMEISDKEGQTLLLTNYGRLGKVYVDKVMAQFKLIGIEEEFMSLRNTESHDTISIIRGNKNIQQNLKDFLEMLCDSIFKTPKNAEDEYKENGNSVKRSKLDAIRYEKVM